MGPLIPDIISPEWSNIVAIIVGIGFGYVLEASGFSSSRKLVGIFYGYDFAVLRVFFTAVVVASLGLLFMDYFGWVNMAELYVFPARISPIIVGGILMGLGFVAGGFCPGTCITAAAIGKIDGIIFLLGVALGIFVFSETFPLFTEFYDSTNLGNITISEYFNISPYWFMAGVSIVTVLSFYIATQVRKRIKKVEY